jgi:hypothetical protein
VMCRSLWQRRPSGADRRGVPRSYGRHLRRGRCTADAERCR